MLMIAIIETPLTTSAVSPMRTPGRRRTSPTRSGTAPLDSAGSGALGGGSLRRKTARTIIAANMTTPTAAKPIIRPPTQLFEIVESIRFVDE
jgi:hypothetical protein